MLSDRLKPLAHPVALSILLLSGLLAAAIQVWAPWSERAGIALAWGVIGYGAAVAIAAIPRHTSTAAATTAAARQVDGVETPEDLVPLTEEALRRLNNLAALGDCALAVHIPQTLNEGLGGVTTAASTSLDIARLLRAVIVDGIERLKPSAPVGSSPSEAEVLRYAILHEEYVLGRPNHQIMSRHNVSESTFHRYRRVGTRALAAELARRELLLSRKPGPS